jgi:hypothetical protein
VQIGDGESHADGAFYGFIFYLSGSRPDTVGKKKDVQSDVIGTQIVD